MAKEKKWDKYLQFDDWKKDEGFEDVKEEEETVENTKPMEIQGLGIKKEEESFDLSSMIAGLNAQNEDYVASEKENEEETAEEKRERERQLEAEEKAAKAKAIFEKEQAEKEARIFAEQEAEAKRIAEELEKKQNNIFNKAGKAFGGVLKGKKGKESIDKTNIETNDKKEDNKETILAEEESVIEILSDADAISLDNDKEEKESEIIKPEELSFDNGKTVSAKEHKKHSPSKKKKESVDGSKQCKIDESEIKKVPSKKDQDSPEIEEINSSVGINSSKEKNNKKDDSISKRVDHKKESAKEKCDEKQSVSLLEGEEDKSSKKVPFWKRKSDTAKPVKEKEPDWKYVATHDEMTGLYNRTAYEKVKKEKRELSYAVIYIDANNLKYANDTIGHEAGDALLKGVADEILDMFPDEGYRIGGDEFIVIMEDIPFKKANEVLSKKRNEFHKHLEKMTKETTIKDLIFSASFGFSFTDGSKEFSVVAKEAEQMMYKEKEMYKKANPKYDMRRPQPEKPKRDDTPKPTNPENYDEMLTKEQRELKNCIRDGHMQVSSKSTQDIVREIQTRASDIIAILIASPTFDSLFIIQTADSFIDIVMDSSYMIDYSYLYIIYKDCPVYKGSDEYLEEVTELFTAIGNGFKTGKIKSEKDLLKIKGINIFKNIYVDA